MTIITGKQLRKVKLTQSSFRKLTLPTLAPFAIFALMVSPVCRAEFKITPTVGVSETYTDNVNLTTDAFAQREFITELTPGITISDKGPNLDLNLVYQGLYFEYSNKDIADTNQFQSALQADAKASIVKEFFYIDSNASISQQSVSAFGQQVNNNPYSDANRTEVKTLAISPYVTQNFGTTATGVIRYSHDAENSGNAQLGNMQSNGILVNLASGPAFRLVNWGLEYDRQIISSTVSPTVTAETASVTGAYLLSPQFSLTLNTGYDEFNYQGIDTGDSREYFWLAGVSWNPSTRTSVQANGGRRYGGSAYTLAATHHTAHSVWIVNYNDSVTTTLSQFATPSGISTSALLNQLGSSGISDPGQLQGGLPSTLSNGINFFNNSFFLQKQLQASAAFNTARTTLVFSVFDTEMTSLSSTEVTGFLGADSNLLLNDNNRQVGGSSLLNWAVTPRSNFYLNMSYTKISSLASDLVNFNRSFVFGMTRHISPRLLGTLELRRNEGSVLLDTEGTYHENAIMASLSLQL